MKEQELLPVDGRKSFYGKAKVIITDDGWRCLRSYDTIVASADPDGRMHRHFAAKTQTTTRHIKAFLAAFSPSFSVNGFCALRVEPVSHGELLEEK